MHQIKLFVEILVFGISLSFINGQEIARGDTSIVTNIREITSSIYQNSTDIHWINTKKQFSGEESFGTYITAYHLNNLFNRIITTSTFEEGTLSSEWYFDGDKLIYVYQTFEYFQESKETPLWKNFKGIGAWESRFYLIDERIHYEKHRGRKADPIKNNDLVKQGRLLQEFVIKDAAR